MNSCRICKTWPSIPMVSEVAKKSLDGLLDEHHKIMFKAKAVYWNTVTCNNPTLSMEFWSEDWKL